MPYNSLEKAFRRILARAGLAFTLHSIRHWAITAIANTTPNMRTGMVLSGHKSHSAFLGYVHSDKAEAAALAEQLAEMTIGLGALLPNVVHLPSRKKR